MKSTKNNNLKPFVLLALFITSYIPLFVLIIIRQISENWQYMHWGGLNLASFQVFVQKFGISTLIIRLLCDYYKTGEMSGKSYGTYSGTEVKVDIS